MARGILHRAPQSGDALGVEIWEKEQLLPSWPGRLSHRTLPAPSSVLPCACVVRYPNRKPHRFGVLWVSLDPFFV